MMAGSLSSAAAAALPAVTEAPIVLGTSLRFQSGVLGAVRTVNVVLPPSYAAKPERRYPVVYVIDGGVEQDLVHVAGTAQLGEIWGRSGEAILVGVETIDRRRELTGPTADPKLLKQYPTAGGSATFRRFLRTEVKPMIAARYRTSGADAVIGESLAGLFIVETYLDEPSLFGGYGAVSPSLWWDQQALSKRAAARVGKAQAGHPLYMTVADEGPEAEPANARVLAALTGRATGWCYAPRPDLTHATIYHTVTPTLFQFLVPPREAPDAAFGFAINCAKRG
jgi:predicted alpha/beta superfamily hydrolase